MDIKFSKIDTLKELVQEVIKKELERLTLIPDASLETTVEGMETKISTNYAPKIQEEFDAKIRNITRNLIIIILSTDFNHFFRDR